jgi:hypothetical protein
MLGATCNLNLEQKLKHDISDAQKSYEFAKKTFTGTWPCALLRCQNWADGVCLIPMVLIVQMQTVVLCSVWYLHREQGLFHCFRPLVRDHGRSVVSRE